jgi:hypothetical protein
LTTIKRVSVLSWMRVFFGNVWDSIRWRDNAFGEICWRCQHQQSQHLRREENRDVVHCAAEEHCVCEFRDADRKIWTS